MDDRFLNEQREAPRPEFSRSLRARLRAAEADGAVRPAFRLRPVLAGATAIALVAVAFTFPAVRATAQQVLDLFRVREFAVVQIDEHRLEQLKNHKFVPDEMFSKSVERLQEPGRPQAFTDLGSAASAAGFELKRPTQLPATFALDTVWVQGEGRVRWTIDTKPLREIMDVMEIRDVDVPAGLDGQRVEVHMPKVVVQKYRNPGRRFAALVQAESPEVSLPPGVDLPRLGEIGLRLLGVESSEAHRLSRVIDWRSTMLVPVVASATRFQQVSVNGARGVLLETSSTATPEGGDHGPGRVLMWTRDGRVYAVLSNLSSVDLVQMAESVR
jgi:hypothetical protein